MKNYLGPFVAVLAVVTFISLRERAPAQNQARHLAVEELRVIAAVKNPATDGEDRKHFSGRNGDVIVLNGDTFSITSGPRTILVPMSNVAYFQPPGGE